MSSLADRLPERSVHAISADGALAWSDNALYDISGELAPSEPILADVVRIAFSPCNRWVVALVALLVDIENSDSSFDMKDCVFSLRVFATSELKAGSAEPRFSWECYGDELLGFAPDGALLIGEGDIIRRGEIGDDGTVTFTTFVDDLSGRLQGLGTYGNTVSLEVRKEGVYGPVFLLYSLAGELVKELSVRPVAPNVGYSGGYEYSLRDWSGEGLCAVEGVDLKALFDAGYLQPDVLKEWIKHCDTDATWDRSGLTLPTHVGSVTVMWPPVAKLLPAALGFEYDSRVAADDWLFNEFGTQVDDVENLDVFIDSLYTAHQGLWDAYEELQQAEQAAQAGSKAKALAASVSVRSMCDEPALAQEVQNEVVDSLCRTCRIAFRHHEPDACKHVNSVLDLVLASDDKPSDPWCSEEAVNHELSQCGKPAAHAQRAALRFGVELRDGLLVPRFRKLATHTRLVTRGKDIGTIAENISKGTLMTVSPAGEFVCTEGAIFSSYSGQKLVSWHLPDAAAFSPCGKWFVCSRDDFFFVYCVEKLRGGLTDPVFDAEVLVGTCVFADDGTMFAVNDETLELLRGKIGSDGAVEFTTIARQMPRSISPAYVLRNRLYLRGRVLDFSGKRFARLSEVPVTHSLAMKRTGTVRTVFSTAKGKVAEIDIPFELLRILLPNARFLKPSVLADLIKLVDERITWSDKGISLPTVDGRKLSIRWEPADGLPQCG